MVVAISIFMHLLFIFLFTSSEFGIFVNIDVGDTGNDKDAFGGINNTENQMIKYLRAWPLTTWSSDFLCY